MRRKLTKQRFELNTNTEVIIESKQKGVDLYEIKTTVVHKIVSSQPLMPKNHSDVIDVIQAIPLEDDQTELFDEGI